MADLHLQTTDLIKRFGGLTATDRLSLEVERGELHAIIGPNGAGKTTLIAQLTGELAPDSGRVQFNGEDITDLPVHTRSGRGLARSFQITNILPDFTSLENVALAIQAHAGHSYRFWQNARKDRRLTEPAQEFIDMVGIGDRAHIQATNLSHGEQRQLEIAMALATKPSMLLLDEPMAGTGPDESVRMVDLLRRLKQSHTILLIEHDMDVVFALADRITVLVYGRAIASGKPEEIRRNPEVRAAYLGEQDGGHA